jgi:hypothetical protein
MRNFQVIRAELSGSDKCIGAGLLGSSRTALSRDAHLPVARLGEETDDYPTVAVLNATWRVIACRQSIQWILQRRRGGPNHWRGQYFCRTREVLVRCAREHAGQIGGDALVVLLRLPEWFPEAVPS